MRLQTRLGSSLWLALCLGACTVGAASYGPRDGEASVCVPETRRCERSTLVTCVGADGGRSTEERTECFASGRVCDPELGCVVCAPLVEGCVGTGPARCRADGSGWDAIGTCDVAAGQGCLEGICQDLCAAAERNRGYLGCEFRALDLDNGIDGSLVASAQQYAVVISNPSGIDAELVVETDESSIGEASRLVTLLRRTVPAGGVDVLELPPRMLDGASAPHLDDGTHSAVTRTAYRLRSDVPVAAYQFNPLQPRDTYSEDASLLLPVSAWGDRYTVVGWPQTYGPVRPLTDGEQFRAFLTVAAGPDGARVTVTLGPHVERTAGCARFPEGRAGDRVEVELGPMDVLNIETDARDADFSGSVVEASRDVAVWVGAEAANAPHQRESIVAAADHLEEQLLPDRALGTDFVLAPLPSRSRAVSRAYDVRERSPVGDGVDEPDWVRLVNTGTRSTRVTTGLSAPFDAVDLAPQEVWDLRLDHGAHIRSEEPLSIIQVVSGQQLTGIPSELPGGDPAMLVVPPTSLFRDRHVVLVPPHHAFDFVVVYAPLAAQGTIDGEPLSDRCSREPIDDDWVVYRCQLGLPILSSEEPRIRLGVQSDGAHTIESTVPVGVVVYGWDRYISYAYPGALSTVSLR